MLEEAEMNLAERICQMDETEITTEVLTTHRGKRYSRCSIGRKKTDKED